jgi:AcrR family transcriptional regulator
VLEEQVPSARRNASATEKAFIDAATVLFAEQGYNGTSINDLAKRLGLTTASLYYHVSGKQDLLFRVLQAGMADFLTSLQETFDSDMSPSDKLRAAVTTHLDYVLERPTAVAVFIRERRFLPPDRREEYSARTDRYDRMFNTIIKQTMDEGAIPPGDPTMLRVMALGMINWLVEWYQPEGRLSTAQIRTSMLDVILTRVFGLKAAEAAS